MNKTETNQDLRRLPRYFSVLSKQPTAKSSVVGSGARIPATNDVHEQLVLSVVRAEMDPNFSLVGFLVAICDVPVIISMALLLKEGFLFAG